MVAVFFVLAMVLPIATVPVEGAPSTTSALQRAERGQSAGPTVTRPIEEFVDAQGTFCLDDGMGGCILFVPPVENFIGWSDPASGLFASVDYAGLADAYADGLFGTEFNGTVTERPLSDGRAWVTVLLRTTNALSWVIDGNGELAFGEQVPDVLTGGAIPSLGDSFLHVKLVNTAPGAPLPDLLQLLIAPEEGQELMFVAFQTNADGLLHEPAGVPEGTPGRLVVVERGLFMTNFNGAVADGFPVERVDLLPTGL
jgi:hypothetical protein